VQWTDTTTTGVTTVSYAITTVGVERKLERRYCPNGGTVPTRTTVIAPNLANPGAVVTCGNGTTYSACSNLDADKSLKLAITPKNGGQFSVDAFREVT
jgi:hypothetical protein